MKLYSSSPTPQKNTPARTHSGWFRRRLLSKIFSVRTAWWVLVVIVAAFAITIVRMFRHLYETVQP